MDEFIVRRDKASSLRFVGERLFRVRSSGDREDHSYSGSPGRWTDLCLYRTRAGKLVVERINCTEWEHEHDRFEGAVLETYAEVIEFFGQDWLAKELYQEANIDNSKAVK